MAVCKKLMEKDHSYQKIVYCYFPGSSLFGRAQTQMGPKTEKHLKVGISLDVWMELMVDCHEPSYVLLRHPDVRSISDILDIGKAFLSGLLLISKALSYQDPLWWVMVLIIQGDVLINLQTNGVLHTFTPKVSMRLVSERKRER